MLKNSVWIYLIEYRQYIFYESQNGMQLIHPELCQSCLRFLNFQLQAVSLLGDMLSQIYLTQ